MEIENLKICRDGEENRMPIRILRVATHSPFPATFAGLLSMQEQLGSAV
jgi:hypothetical protein